MHTDHASGGRAQGNWLWDGDAERLDHVLTSLGAARSGTQARELIAQGSVRLNGAVASKAGARVARGSRIEAAHPDHYVSRAAHKLIAGLEVFGVDAAGVIALDLGASTGGFTQVLLERDAATVLAVDVGRDQFADELRDDARVRLVEGCNARDLTRELLASLTGVADPPTLVVADLSFISLELILPAIARTASDDATCVLLIKPQFEVGRVRDGVVTSPGQWASAIRSVLRAAVREGFAVGGIADSPITGGAGNREFLVLLRRGQHVNDAGSDHADPTEWDVRVSELTGAEGGGHD